MTRKRKSGWKFETSQGVAAQVSVIVGVGGGEGSITLTDPRGSKIRFGYVSAGVGGGLGGKVNLGYSTEDFPSSGTVYMTEAFRGRELEATDLVGACVITEVSIAIGGPKTAGVGGGGQLTGMFLGIPPDKLQAQFWVSAPGIIPLVLREFGVIDIPSYAKAVLVMKGGTQGWGVGIGALESAGYVWIGGVSPPEDMMPEVIYEGPTQITAKDDFAIVIPGHVLFDTNEFRIKREAEPALRRAGARIRSFPQHRTIINGYADSRHTEAYNRTLSKKRADAVKRWLVARGYVKEPQASTYGHGESDPVMPNTTPQNMERNRRVEILLVRREPQSPARLPKDWYIRMFDPRLRLPLKTKPYWK